MTLCVEMSKTKKSSNLELIENDQYIICYGFMRKELRLEKTELLVYSIIYGYYKSGCEFKGNVKYLSEWSGSGVTAVKAALSSLVAKGYLNKSYKTVGIVTYAVYEINANALPDNAKTDNTLQE